MLGYVTCHKAELKIREFEIYEGYYCGICKSIGTRYGQLPRMALSFDAVFLALLLSGAKQLKKDNLTRKDTVTPEHCIIHHIRKKPVVRNDAIEYAGDIMLILAWFKLEDDVRDEGKFSSKIAMGLNRSVYKKLLLKYPDLCESVEKNLSRLSLLENQNCANLDEISDIFAAIMEEVFAGYGNALPKEARTPHTDRTIMLLRKIGRLLGKWIYVIDAWDDLEENLKDRVYNPLLYRYTFNKEQETVEEFRRRIQEDCKRNMLIYLAEMTKVLDLLELGQNKDIIENIVYMGLLRRTERALEIKSEKITETATEKRGVNK